MDLFITSEQIIFSAGMKPKPWLRGIIDVLAGLMQTRCSMNQKKQRRDYTDEFKNDAVKLVTEKGYSCTEVAQRLGVDHTNISRWVRQYPKQIEKPTQITDPSRKWKMSLNGSKKKINAFSQKRK
jgi:transposase-like protein